MHYLKIYDGIQPVNSSNKEEVRVFVKNSSIIDLLYLLRKEKGDKINIAVLDHACYKEPAPYFLRGARGIEEDLCANSELYNTLTSEEMSEYFKYNKKHLNRGIYLDRGFYISEAIFNNGDAFNIIGATAPNKKNGCTQYHKFTEEENYEALKNRIDFILSIASINNTDIFVMSSFGCNVYGQDILDVSSILKELLETKYKYCFKEIYITDEKDDYYKVWEKVFG